VEFIPRYVIFQTCLPEGRRLDKRVRQMPAVMRSTTPVREPYVRNSNVLPKHDFRNEEYRFWMPMFTTNGSYYTCRYCCTTVTSAAARKDHMESRQCTTKCVAVYKDLLKAGKCVICGEHTNQQKWGVPMHERKCQDQWTGTICSPHLMSVVINEHTKRELELHGAK
jgi:hypothetical protein